MTTETQPRIKQFTVLCNSEEYQIFEKAAMDSRLSMSAWGRRVLWKEAHKASQE